MLVEDGRAMSPAANFLRSISKAYKEGTISPAERSRIKRHLIGTARAKGALVDVLAVHPPPPPPAHCAHHHPHAHRVVHSQLQPGGAAPLLQKQMPAESHPVSPLERCTIVQGVRAQARLDCLSEEMVRTPEKGSATPFTMGNSSITSDDDSLDSSVSLLCAGYNVRADINALGFSGGPV